MKVGVICEFSGAVRDAFVRAGHDAVSCAVTLYIHLNMPRLNTITMPLTGILIRD